MVTTENSTLLYSFCKERILNVISSTALKKHLNEILNECRTSAEFSILFYYLPSITDRKEDMNQWWNNVNLDPIDCSLEFLSGFSTTGTQFRPDFLESNNPEIREPQVQILYAFFNHMVQVSNNNLVKNSDNLILTLKLETRHAMGRTNKTTFRSDKISTILILNFRCNTLYMHWDIMGGVGFRISKSCWH